MVVYLHKCSYIHEGNERLERFKIVIPLYYILLFFALYKDETCLLYIRTQYAPRSKHNSVIQKQQANVV